MTIPQIRLLAEHHRQQAATHETYAEMQVTLFADTGAATRFRLTAEWHSNTAVHLEQFADGLTEGIRLLESLNLQPSKS
jgi:hypothetical protein